MQRRRSLTYGYAVMRGGCYMRAQGCTCHAPTPGVPAKGGQPAVQKEMRSAPEIRDELARLLNARALFPVTVPLPVIVPRSAANFDCNWDVPREFRTLPGFQIDIGLALIAVKKKWDIGSPAPALTLVGAPARSR